MATGGAIGGLLLIGLGSACSSPSSGDGGSAPVEMVDSGSWYVREAWPHDGNQIESENFVVYSDAASLEARRTVAEVGEAVLAESIAEMDIDPETMFRFPPGQDKIDIYAYHAHDPQDWAGRAYYAGLITWSPDHPQRQSSLVGFEPAFKHELVHVIQWLLTGPEGAPVDTWFIEGLPEAMTGGTTGGAIRGLDQLNELTTEYGTISPISVKSYSQITDPAAGERFHYPMFQLAVDYLIDDEGHGRSLADATDVLIDVADGAPFEVAFEDRMGIPLHQFENDFFRLMEAYLPRYRSPVFTPVGFGLVSALVIVLVIGAPAFAYRQWRPGAAPRSFERPAPGRAARFGFHSEYITASLVVIVFFLGALFAVGTAGVLYNATNTVKRVGVLWILAGYLVAAVGILLWAVHRWTHRSRAAFLVAPLVIVATGATIVSISAMF